MVSSNHKIIFRVYLVSDLFLLGGQLPEILHSSTMAAFLRSLVALATACLPRPRRPTPSTPSQECLLGDTTPPEEAAPTPKQCVKTTALLVEIHGVASLTKALIPRLPGIYHVPFLSNVPFCGRGKLHIRWSPEADFAADGSLYSFLLISTKEIKLFLRALALSNNVWTNDVPVIRYSLELELEFQRFADKAHLTSQQKELKLAKSISGYLSGYHHFIVTGTDNTDLIHRLQHRARSPHWTSVHGMTRDIIKALHHGQEFQMIRNQYVQAAQDQWNVAAVCQIVCSRVPELCVGMDSNTVETLMGYRFFAL